MKKLVLESTAPFQGLCELVAYKEGLFEKEGLAIEFADRGTGDKNTHTDVTDPKDANPHASHGMLFEQGKADMYNACEWATTAGCRTRASTPAGRSAGVPSSPTPDSWSGPIRPSTRLSSSPTGWWECRSSSAPTT